MPVELIHSQLLDKYKALCHFTTTTYGGVSEGNYATFNLGLYSGDSPENVMENRSRLVSAIGLPLENLFLPYQTHGDKVYVIDKEFLQYPSTKQMQLLSGVDAVITDIPLICIGVTTADCVPVLLFDPENKVFAAVHAGWRGTVANIVGKTIEEMIRVFGSVPQNLVAYIGPAISQAVFEVGEEVVLAFENAGLDLERIGKVNDMTKKTHIDLSLANQILLQKSGLNYEKIDVSGICTYRDSLCMFSARRQSIKSGRIVSGGYLY